MYALNSKYTDHSDGFDIYICRNCGTDAIVNVGLNLVKCRRCLDNAVIHKIPSTWSSKTFFQELRAMGFGTYIGVEPYHIVEKEK